MAESPLLNLPYMPETPASPDIIHNAALNILEAISHLAIKDRDLTAPPGTQVNGDVFLVATGGTGDWSGQDGLFAIWYDGWIRNESGDFPAPREGMSARVLDENVRIEYDGAAWTTITTFAGSDAKDSVAVASTANLTLSGEQTIDGVLTSASRILVKNQTSVPENGIYVTAAGAWARATDADSFAELVNAFVWVEQGTVGADTGWVCTVNSGGTLGVTNVTWAQFNANVDNSTLEVVAGVLRVKDSGITTAKMGGDVTTAGKALLTAANAAAQLVALGVPLHNFTASVPPTHNEDSGDGYSVGSCWYDTTSDKVYTAVSVAVGLADWREVGVVSTERRFIQHTAIPQGTTFQISGQTAVGVAGTAANADDASHAFVQYTPAGGVNAAGGLTNIPTASAQFRRDWEADGVFLVKTGPSLTDVRIFVGFNSTLDSSTSSPITDLAMFRYATDVDGTAFWRFGTADGAAATWTATAIAVAVDTVYKFRIRMLASVVMYYVNDILIGVATANLPTATVYMVGEAYSANVSATARAFKVGRVSVRMK